MMNVVLDCEKLAGYFDHTLLKPTAGEKDILELCAEANNYNVASVCVNLSWVQLARKNLDGKIKVCSVIDFPFGASTPLAKYSQVKEACEVGAREVDVVINVGKLLEGDKNYCIKELKPLADFAHDRDMILKVIVETCFLSETNVKDACEVIEASRADFIKTSTGYGSRGASFEDIKLFKKYLKGETKIKASGGIRSLDDVMEYISLGCSRIGASRTVAIMNEAYSKGIIADK